MRLHWIQILVLAALLAGSRAHAFDLQEDSAQLSGTVTAKSNEARTLTLDQTVFSAPSGVEGFEQVSTGDEAIVYFEDQGTQKVATRIMLAPAN